MCAAVITHGYSPPVLDPAKHDLDLMPLFIQILIVRAGSLSAPSGWDAGRNASGTQGIMEPVGVITTVRQQLPGLRQSIYGIHKQGGSFVVAYLACRELHGQGPAVSVAKGMEFGVQPALCAADAAGKSPFLSKLAAVRCALRWVASIITWPSCPAVFANSVKMLLKMPIWLQRKKRL